MSKNGNRVDIQNFLDFCPSLGTLWLSFRDQWATMKERRKKRTKEEIIYQILEACSKGTNITAIAEKVALTNKITNSYLKILIKNGLVQEKNKLFTVTPKGERILPVMKKVQDTLSYSTAFITVIA